MKSIARKFLVNWSAPITVVLIALASVGYILGSGIQLKLSLTDLLPENHPAVVKFNKLTEVVGGVGFLTVILEAQDGESHLKVAPTLAQEFKKNPWVRSVFFNREKKFFVDRLLYYIDLPKLKEMEGNIDKQITRARRKAFDLGLWDDEEEAAKKSTPVFDKDVSEMAKKSAGVSPHLMSRDKKHLLLMIKPDFDSMDLEKTEALVKYVEGVLKAKLPATVTYDFTERYYNKLVETKQIQSDIFVLGTASILFIALLIFIYMRSWRAMLVIFVPVLLGMGITVGLTRLVIGHINIITGFLMGIVSGLGVDYGIHLVLRLRLERTEPSSKDPNPVWRALESSGHSVFIGAMAASFAFYLLTFSTFRAFSEFGFICGTGITAVLMCLLCTFSTLTRFFKLDTTPLTPASGPSWFKFPVLPIPYGFRVGMAISGFLLIAAFFVRFEYDFSKMMQNSPKVERLNRLVDDIYDRNGAPSAFSAPTKEQAVGIENLLKEKYYPATVADIISGATIVPDNQKEKQVELLKIKEKVAKIKDRFIEKALDVPAESVRTWVNAKPFTFADLPLHLQDTLRGTKQSGFLMYLYPNGGLNEANKIHAYADMIRDVEKQYPEVLTGSDAVIFSDILRLIERDGSVILLVIFLSVGVFIWLNVRKWQDTMLSYVPLLVALPVGMGLMALFGVKFNIFNIAIIPTFVAMGIDVPIHVVHRTREIGSGFKAARDLAASINLALVTAGVGFGVLVFARAGVLQSLGWISLLATSAIWWVGLLVLPAYLERFHRTDGHTAERAGGKDREFATT